VPTVIDKPADRGRNYPMEPTLTVPGQAGVLSPVVQSGVHMGQDIKMAIDEVRAPGTKFAADGQAFRDHIIAHLEQLNLPGNAFPAWDMGLKTSYELARTATVDVSKAAEETLTSIGKA